MDRHDFPELPTNVDNVADRDTFLELNEIILSACKNNISDRYRSAWDMHADFVVMADGKSVRRLKLLERRLTAFKRTILFAASIATVLGLLGYQGYRYRENEVEARQRQVGSDVAYGNRAVDAGDMLGALPYFVDALKLETDEREAAAHRLRIGSTLAQCPKLTRLWSAAGRIGEAQIAPDGRRALVAESLGKFFIGDLVTGQRVYLPFVSTNWLRSATFSPDGSLIATFDNDGLVHILTADHFEQIAAFHHPGGIASVRFNPDGSKVVTAGGDGVVRIWNWQSGMITKTLSHSAGVRFADFCPDGSMVVTASEDRTARIWNLNAGNWTVLEHPSWVYRAAFSPDGSRVVTGCADHKARVWDVKTGQQILPDLSHGDGVVGVEYNPDGRTVLTASLDGVLRIWDAKTLQPQIPVPFIQLGERLIDAHFGPDGRQIIAGGGDGTVWIWDFAGALLPPVPEHATFSRDGSSFFELTNDSIAVGQVGKRETVDRIIHLDFKPQEVVFSARGLCIAAMGPVGIGGTRAKVWTCSNGKLAGSIMTLPQIFTHAAVPDSASCFAAFGGDLTQLWNPLSGKPLSPILTNSAVVDAICFNQDKIEVRDARSGQLRFPPLRLMEYVHWVEFSHDGSRIVGCCWDRLITKCYAQVWSVADGKPVSPKLMHGDGVFSASFSLDDRKILTASEDFTAIVWDAATGTQIIPPVFHEEKVRQACFSPSGGWFATASFDETARVWNSLTGDPLTPPLRESAPLTNVVFTPNGDTLLTRQDDGMMCRWNLSFEASPISELVGLSRLLAGRRETRFGSFNSTKREPLETTWKNLVAEYPKAFTVTSNEIEAWHVFQAVRSKAEKNLTAEAFHSNIVASTSLERISR
jgi:WD40 repeat protein